MNKTRFFICTIGIFFLNSLYLKAQININNQQTIEYQSAYNFINSMLADEIPLSFKDAVFATENAYHENGIDSEDLNNELTFWLN